MGERGTSQKDKAVQIHRNSSVNSTGQKLHTMDVDKNWEELVQLVVKYISDTLNYIQTVQHFCEDHGNWLHERENELKAMRGLGKGKGRLEKKLKEELEKTLKGLEKLTLFLEAVEKLAVTSLSFFEEENPFCHLLVGKSSVAVNSVISDARKACPLLIHFKRDNRAFFLPNLINVDALVLQLNIYLQKSKDLYERIGKGSKTLSFVMIHRQKEILMTNICSNLTNAAMQEMLDHLKELTNIRKEEDFRLTFLFGDSSSQFITEFSKRRARMREFLGALEERAVQLDRMKMGASISSVAGSTVGLASGVVSIVGLALAPVTAGTSLILTMVGVGLGVTSGVNSLATGEHQSGQREQE
ncbi:hypothetical protein MATL_G00217730 [Megalops atlanticus]|uniref:Uncharacterized protein n=1 Tax=Megalops atlanticus TaxID=7932 RepID=A0A9D3PH53_MEGAT|nr:hypothetical protein MATL_G00217730 [Megalops atlanticus]